MKKIYKLFVNPRITSLRVALLLSVLLLTGMMQTMAQTPIYVNTSAGNDSWSGTTPDNNPDGSGPKATIGAGVTAVTDGGQVSIAAGTYVEDVSISKNLTLSTSGSVTLSGNLSVTGTHEITMNGDMDITGGLYLEASGDKLTLGAYSVSIGGAWTGSGFVVGGSTSNLTLGGSCSNFNLENNRLNNFTINGAGTVTLKTNFRIDGALTLTGATDILAIDAYALTLDGTTSGDGFVRGTSSSDLTIGGSGVLGTINITGELQTFTVNRGSGSLTLGACDFPLYVNTLNMTAGELILTDALSPFGNDLSVSGSYTRGTGTFRDDGNSSVLDFTGSVSGNLYFSGASTPMLGELDLNTSGTINLATAMNLSSANVTTGTLTTSASITFGSISDAANFTLGADASVTGNFSITDPAAVFTVGAHTLTFNGDVALVAGCTYYADGTSSLVFNGASIYGNDLPSNIASLNNLTINRTAGVTMSTDLDLLGTLTLTDGTFSINGNTLTLHHAIPGTTTNWSNLTGDGAATLVLAGSANIDLEALTLKDFNVSLSAGKKAILHGDVNVLETLNLISGLVDHGDKILMADATTIERSGGKLSAEPVFGSSVTILYSGSVKDTTGFELPSTGSVTTDIVLNNSHDVLLGSSYSFNNLVLNDGKLLCGTFTLTPYSITGGSSTSYIVADPGSLAMHIPLSTTTTFPVGYLDGYTPVSINNSLAADFAVSVKPVTGMGSFAAPVPSPNYLKVQWTISRTGSGTAGVTFTWNPAEDFTTTPGTPVLGRFNGTKWVSAGSTSFGSQMATVSGITQFSPFTGYGDPITPIYVNNATGSDSNTGENATDSPAGTGPKSTISQAILAVADPGTIYVAAGTYSENVVVDKDITIHGAGATTIVNGTGPTSVFEIATSGVTLEDMKIDNGGSAADAVLVDAGLNNILIQEDTITNNVANGIHFTNAAGSNNVVLNNHFTGTSSGAAIANDGATIVTATGNNFASSKGPSLAANTCGDGKVITANITYNPWKNSALTYDIYQLEDKTLSGPVTICEGGSTTVTLTSPQVGTNYEYRLYRNTTLVPSSMQTGSGTHLDWLVTEATAGVFTYTVKVFNTYNGCELLMSTSAVVTVNLTPTVTQPGDQTLCNNAGTTKVTFTGTGATSYTWTNDTPSIGLSATGTGDIDSFTAVNTTTSPVTATVVVTPKYTNAGKTCSGATKTFSITVNPTPSVTNAATANTCNGTGPNISLTANVASNFAWTIGTVSGGITGASSGSGGTINQTLTNPSSVSAGSVEYLVTPTSTGGSCAGSAYTITVNVPTTLLISVTSHTDVLCYGNSTGIAIASSSGGSSGYQYLWSNGQTGSTASGLTANNYTVTVTDAINCTATATVTISQPSASLTASVTSHTDILCKGNSSGAATVTANFGTSSYSYLWNNTQTGATASGLSAGLYTVTVTDAHGCTATATASITEPDAILSVTISGQTDILCHGLSTGSAVVSVSGGTPAYHYLWNNGQTTNTASGLTAGNYTVTVTDDNSCKETATASIVQPGSLSANPVFSHVMCNGNAEGAIDPQISGGTGGYSYLWDDFNLSADPVLTGITAGSYHVTITDDNTCTLVVGPLTITEPELFDALNTAHNVSCLGGSNGHIDQNYISGGVSPYYYSWSNGETTPGISGLTAGTYYLTVSDSHSCTIPGGIWVQEPDVSLDASAEQTKLITCFGGSDGEATVTPLGGWGSYFYLWNNSQTGLTATGLTAGNYTVTVTDDGGCSVTTSASVSGPATALTASAAETKPVSCFGSSDGTAAVYASGGWGSLTYLWNNSQTNTTLSGLSAGTYTVTVTDLNSCSVTATAAVTGPAGTLAATAAETRVVSCYNIADGEATVYPSLGWGSYTYTWNNTQTNATATGLSAGTYTVTVTDLNSCKVTATATVTGPSGALAVTAAGTKVVTCFGGIDGTATAYPSSGWGSYTYLWNNNQTGATASGLSAGTYTVTVSDLHSCSSTASATVTGPSAAMAATTGTTPVTCFGESNGSATVYPSDGWGSYSYLWNNNQTGVTATGLSAGSYYVTVTDLQSCSITATATVSGPSAAIAANASNTRVVSCFGGTDGEVTVYPSFGWGSYTFIWNNTQTGATATSLSAGTYTVTVTDLNSCKTTATAAVAGPTGTLAASAAETKVVTCFGGNDGTATVYPSSGWGSYTYLWNNSQTGSTASGLSAGTYSVTVSDLNSCTVTATATVTRPSEILAASAAGTKVVTCFGGSDGEATVTASGGWNVYDGAVDYTYLWNNAQTGSTATALSAGTYTVTVTDVHSCSVTATATVTGPAAALTASAAGTKIVTCFGGTDGEATVYPTNGWGSYSFLWNNSQTGTIATGLSAGTYTVTVTDLHSCKVTATASVTGPSEALTASAAGTHVVTCFGGSDGQATVTASGGWNGFDYSNAYTYLWNNAQTGHIATSLTAGTYTVTVTDQHGCSVTATAAVSGPSAALAASAAEIKPVSCFGENNGTATVYPSNGWGSYTYTWNNTQTGATATGLSAGNYTVTVSDGHGCTTTATAYVSQPDASLTSSYSKTNVPGCYGDHTGAINLTVTGGTSPYYYAWTGAGVAATAEDQTGLAAGTYNVTITDARSCTTSTSAVITQPDQLASNPSYTNVLCNGNPSGAIDPQISGGTPGYTYTWDDFNLSSYPILTGVTAGTYHVTVTDNNTCMLVVGPLTITEPELFDALNTAHNVSCKGASDGHIDQNYISGGVSPYYYSWSNGATTTGISGLTAGTYYLTVSDSHSCTIPGGIWVQEPDFDLTATATQSNPVTCFNGGDGAATVSPDGGWGGYTYLWNNGQTGATATSLTAGTYTVTVSDDGGCKFSTSTVVNQPGSALTASAVQTKPVTCFGGTDGTATVYPSGGWSSYTYLWNNTQTGSTATGLSAGTYTVTVTDLNSCKTTATAAVAGPTGTLAASAAETKVVTCFGGNDGTATAYPSSGWGSYTYLWNNSQTGSTASGLSAGTYTVTVSDLNSCTVTASATVTGPSEILAASAAGTQVVTCFGGSDGEATVTASGGWNVFDGAVDYTYLWNNAQTGSTATALSAGTYTVTVTDQHSCSVTATATVTGPSAALAASAAGTKIVTCFGGTDGEATVYPSNGWGSFTYLWNNAQTVAVATGLTAGIYTATVTDLHGCKVTATANVAGPSQALTASAAGTHVVTCFGGADGQATVTASGGWNGYDVSVDYTYHWNNSQTGQIATSLTAGTYSVTVTDQHGCTVTATASVSGPSAALASSAAETNPVSCFGESNGTATVYPSGGWASYTYHWNNNQTAATASGLTVGTYSITVTDGHGCTTTASTYVSQPDAALTSSYSKTNVLGCYGDHTGAINVTVTGGTSPYYYAWTGTGVAATAEDQTGLAAGTYNLTITDARSCTTSTSAVISQPDQLTSNPLYTDVLCNGNTSGAIDPQISGGIPGYAYTWDDFNLSSDPILTGVTAGTYHVTVTDNNTCVLVVGPLTITEPELFDALNTAHNVSCKGASDGHIDQNYISGGVSPYYYSWSNGETTPGISGLTAGTYYLTVSDSHSCTIPGGIWVQEPDFDLTATAAQSKPVTCFNGGDGEVTVTPDGGWGSYSYLWNNGQTGATATSLTAGNYTVTVSDGGGCSVSTTASLSGPAALLAATATQTDPVSCSGGQNGSATVYPSAGWGNYTYLWNNTQTGATATGLSAGTYTVTVTDLHSCTATASATVAGPALALTASAAQTQPVSCVGGNNGQATAYPSHGWGSYTYIWNNSQTGATATGLSAAVYTVTVTDLHGCTTTAAATVHEPPTALAASAAGTHVVSCFGGNDGQATVTASGGWNVFDGSNAYTYLWNNTQTGHIATSLTAGTYTVTVTDQHSCSVTATAAVSGPAAALDASAAESKPVSCIGESNGTATVYPSNGWGSYTFLWNNTQTGATATGLSVGTYTVTVTDGHSCKTTATTYVSQPDAALTSSYSQTNVLGCHGDHTGVIDLTATGGTSPYYYAWTGSGVDATAEDQIGLAAGTYNVTITDAHSCTTSTSASISQPDQLASNPVITDVLCNGNPAGAINPQISGGTPDYSYSWDDFNLSSDPILTGVTAGTYYVTVTDNHSCVFVVGPLTITEPELFDALNTAHPVTCQGASDGHIDQNYISGGVSPYFYNWSNGETTPGISGLTAGTYYLTVSDSHSCTIPGGIWVQGPDYALGASAQGQPVTCFGDSDGTATVTTTGGWETYTYLWNNSQTGATATGLSAGNYSVTVNDGGGCSVIATATVYGPGAAIAASVAQTQPVSCVGGNNGEATAYPSNGWGSYTYIWNNAQTGATATGLSAATYTVTITDLHGCKTTASAAVNEPAVALTASAAGTKVVTCFGGSDGEATVTATGGWNGYDITADYTYHWNNSQTGQIATSLTAGTYTVTVTDQHSCSVTATATVTGPSAALAASAAGTKIVTCFGGTDGEATVYPSNGWGSFTYLWNNAQTVAVATGLTAGIYTATVTDLHGCKVTATANVAGPSQALTASAAGTHVVTCFGGSDGQATVTASGGWNGYDAFVDYTYHWNNSQTGQIATSLTAGTYSVTVTDQHGCTVTATASVSGPSAALASSAAETNPVSCFSESNGTATVYPSGGWASYTYHWNNNQTAATASGLTVGTYSITVTDGHGCTTTASAYVSQPAESLTSSHLTTDVEGCHGDHTGAIDLSVSGGTSPYYYVWTGTGVDATAEEQTGLGAGTYNVTITDARSCTTSAMAIISEPSQMTANPTYTNILCNGNPEGAIAPNISGGTSPYSYQWNDFNLTTDEVLTGVIAGDYFVTVTDDHSCVLVAGPLSVTQPELFDALNTAHPVTCKGASDGFISQNYISGGVSPYYYIWSNGETTPGISGLTAGTYYLTVTDSHSCTIPGGIWVQEPDYVLGASAVQSLPVTCFGDSDGTATVTATGGWGTYTYLWNNSQTGAIATGLSAGSYSVTVNDGGSCSVTASATVYGPGAAIAATAAETKVVSCYGGNDGQATAYPSFGWGSYTYVWNNTQTGVTATGLSVGNYTVTVTDLNGCKTTASATITGPSGSLAAHAAGTKVVTCFGDTDGEATVYPSFGWGSYTYLWNNSQTVATANGLSAGTYTVTVTDLHSCMVTATASVSGPPSALSASAAGTHVVTCFGGNDGQATVTASGGWSVPVFDTPNAYTYQWNNSQTNRIATSLTAGVYSVTVTDQHGCTVTATASVSGPSAALAASAAETKPVTCFGGSDGTATVYPSDGWASYTYHWNNSQTGAIATTLTAGTYTVTVTDGHGCTATASAAVSGPSGTLSVTASQSKPVTCFGGTDGEATAYPSLGWGSYSYTWNNSQTGAAATSLTAGTYTVTITDGHGCSATASALVSQPSAALAASAAGTKVVTCFGGNDGTATVYPTNGWGSYSYIWNNSQTGAIATSLTAGTYSVTVSDLNGCTATASATVTGPGAALDATAGETKPVTCFGGIDGTATVYPSNGWGSYSYVWNNTQTVATATGLSAGTYLVTVTDGHSCTVTASATVSGPSGTLTATAAETKVVTCFGGSDGTAAVYPSFGWGSYTYLWNNTQTGATANSLTAGNYTVTVSDLHGCTTTASATVTGPTASLASSAAETKMVSCFGGDDGEATVYPSFGWGSYAYSWNNTQTSATATGLTAGTYPVTVSDGHGCTTTASASVGQPSAALALNTTHEDVLCKGGANGSIDLSVSGGTPSYTYFWTGAGVAATAQDQSGLSAGTYYVTVTDSKNCSKSTAVVISEPTNALAVSITPTGVSCHGDSNGSATVNVSGGTSGYTYIWSTSPAQTTGTVSNLAPGSYSVTVTDAHTCSATATATIDEPAVLSLSGSVINYSCNHDGSVTTTVSGGTTTYHYIWNNGQTTSAITGLTVGTYSVTVSDAHNCSQTGSWEVITATIGITGPDIACCSSGNQSDYTATVANTCAPITYQWAVSGGSIISGQNTSAISVVWSCCGNGTVTLVVHNCDGCNITKTLPVTVNTPPTPSISGPVQVASGQTNTQYCTPASAQIGHVYVWTIAGGSITAGQGTTCITVTWGPYPVCGCGSVTLSESFAGCMSSENYPVTMLPASNIRIYGNVNYLNAPATRMNGVTIQLRNSSNVIVGTTQTYSNPATGQSGYYAFTDLVNDTYSLHGSYGGTWGGNNATDALIVQLSAVGSYPLAGVRALAADVNASTTITALDALYIKLRTVGAISSYPAGDWKVTDTTVTLTGTAAFPVDLKMLCTGDVNGSFVPQGFKDVSSLSGVDDGVMAVTVGEPFTYSIHATQVTELGAMTLFMGYDAGRFEIIDVAGLPDGMKYSVGNGTVAIAWSDTKALRVKENDLVLSLNMRVKEKITEPSQVFSIRAGSEFADIMATPYENFDLKMASVLTPDGSKNFSMSNYPNPFAQTTTIIYNLPEGGHVKLVLTDLLGNTIRTLEDHLQVAGIHTAVVDPAALNMAPGVYLYKLIFDNSTDTYTKVNKMVFTR